MSYDVNFWFPQPGQSFDEWAEAFDGTYPSVERQRLRDALGEVRTQVSSLLPDAGVVEQDDGFAIDDDESAISFGYSPSGVSLSCPYRHGAGASRIPLVYDIATTVASLTGLEAWDPQTDSPVEPSNLSMAVEVYERTARFAESLISRPHVPAPERQ
jgi:hypothetical protein